MQNTIHKAQTIVQTNQKIKSAMFSHTKKNIFPPKKMYVPPYYDKISSKSERVVEWGTHDISLVPHHLYRIPKLRTLEPPPLGGTNRVGKWEPLFTCLKNSSKNNVMVA